MPCESDGDSIMFPLIVAGEVSLKLLFLGTMLKLGGICYEARVPKLYYFSMVALLEGETTAFGCLSETMPRLTVPGMRLSMEA